MSKIVFILLSLWIQNFSFAQHGQENQDIKFLDSCRKLERLTTLNTISNAINSAPLIVANNIIIRGSEIDTNFIIENIFLIKCPESFSKFGNLGANGVIELETKQKFETVTPTQIYLRSSHLNKRKIIYALNGVIFTDTTLKISKNAIKNIEFITNLNFNNLEDSRNVTCISIWTKTKKELKKNKIPALCRGVVFANRKDIVNDSF